jgi:zinc transporter ZupT
MRRSWNWFVWAGFGVALLAAFSYIPFFSRFPSTRDIPWANLLLFLAAGCFLAIGLYRAFTQAGRYRVKISGTVLSALSFMLFALFCFGVFYAARNIPPAHNALRVGQRAPDFMLADTTGKLVTLAQLRQGKRAVLLIFYRGYW